MNANPTLPGAFANAIYPMGKEEKRRPVFDKAIRKPNERITARRNKGF